MYVEDNTESMHRVEDRSEERAEIILGMGKLDEL